MSVAVGLGLGATLVGRDAADFVGAGSVGDGCGVNVGASVEVGVAGGSVGCTVLVASEAG